MSSFLYPLNRGKICSFDFDKKRLSVQCLIPRYQLNFDYELSGKILVLPITGQGPGLIILRTFLSGFNWS